jgi:phage baseplate assembly protein W
MYLQLQASFNLTIQTLTSGRQGTLSIQATATDTRPFLFVKHVGLAVDWGDGSKVESIEQALSPYTTSFQHFYKPGNFTVKVTAKNYQLPLPETVVKSYAVVVKGNVRPQTPDESGLQPIFFGPILPRDSGFPNADDWSWQFSQDSGMLESSAKLLLLTPKGTRLMNPDYGTRIRQLLFDQSDSALRDAVTQEIRSAFSVHEPRVEVSGVDVSRTGSKQISVYVNLISKIDRRPFQLSTSVVKT